MNPDPGTGKTQSTDAILPTNPNRDLWKQRTARVTNESSATMDEIRAFAQQVNQMGGSASLGGRTVFVTGSLPCGVPKGIHVQMVQTKTSAPRSSRRIKSLARTPKAAKKRKGESRRQRGPLPPGKITGSQEFIESLWKEATPHLSSLITPEEHRDRILALTGSRGRPGNEDGHYTDIPS